MPSDREGTAPLGGMPVATEPAWTNPNVGMIALISAVHSAYGAGSLDVMREGMRRLGRRTGQAMLDAELVSENCSPTEWGRFTHQLMDLTGMYVYQEITATDRVYEFSVPSGAWPYHEPQRHLEGPGEVCDIPADWDRGCLETINPRIRMTQPKCSARGDDQCLWRYELIDE